jgi:hypothetical protein
VQLDVDVHTKARRKVVSTFILWRVLSAGEMASARPNLFIWTISRSARGEREKEREENRDSSINKTSQPQIFALHAERAGEKRRAYIKRRRSCFICLVSPATERTVDKISNHKKQRSQWLRRSGGFGALFRLLADVRCYL